MMSEWDFSEHVRDIVEYAHNKALENGWIGLVSACPVSQITETTFHESVAHTTLCVNHLKTHSPDVSVYVLGADISNVMVNT